MKRNLTIFFTGDIVSAIFASVIFTCTLVLVVSHFIIGIRGFGLFLECCMAYGGWGLVKATYSENKKEYMIKKQESK